MSLWSNIYDSLRACLPDDVPVIRRDQDGKIPPRTFVVAKVIADVREGHAAVGLANEGGVVTIQQGSLLTVSINAYGPEAWDVSQALVNGMNRITVQDVLHDKGFAYVRHLKGPEDLTGLQGTGFEDRVHQDIQLRTNVVITDDIGIIETVEITGLINGTLEFQDTITIAE